MASARNAEPRTRLLRSTSSDHAPTGGDGIVLRATPEERPRPATLDQPRRTPRVAIVIWIERTYHRRRRQRGLGRLTPIEFETLYTGEGLWISVLLGQTVRPCQTCQWLISAVGGAAGVSRGEVTLSGGRPNRKRFFRCESCQGRPAGAGRWPLWSRSHSFHSFPVSPAKLARPSLTAAKVAGISW